MNFEITRAFFVTRIIKGKIRYKITSYYVEGND